MINPAWYECPKGTMGIHWWKRNKDLTAQCENCGLILNQFHASELYNDHEPEQFE